MRIVSNFHDYYDGVQIYGFEQDIVYIREHHISEIKSGGFQNVFNYFNSPFVLNSFILGFCGKIHLAAVLADSHSLTNGHRYCYTIEHIDRYYSIYANKKQQSAYWNSDKRLFTRCINRKNFVSIFKQTTEKASTNKEYLKYFDIAPIFRILPRSMTHLNHSCVEYNPNLKRIGFQSVMDSYTAYQELAMWLSNKAQPEKPIPVPSDKDMVEIKGFDSKYSFRKEPTKKKRK